MLFLLTALVRFGSCGAPCSLCVFHYNRVGCRARCRSKREDGFRAMWVFGYGSLIWNPEFPPADTRPARLWGWRRSFCMLSVTYRGTEATPGLVLALDRDAQGWCDGLALRLPDDGREEALAALRLRELTASAYRECQLPLALQEGGEVRAITYVVDREEPHYCALSPEEQASRIARAQGDRGANADYLGATVAALARIGVVDPELQALWSRVQALRATGPR